MLKPWPWINDKKRQLKVFFLKLGIVNDTRIEVDQVLNDSTLETAQAYVSFVTLGSSLRIMSSWQAGGSYRHAHIIKSTSQVWARRSLLCCQKTYVHAFFVSIP